MPHAPEERALRAQQRSQFNTLRANGMGITAAAREVKVSRQHASKWDKLRVAARRQGASTSIEVEVDGGPSPTPADPHQRRCRQCGTAIGKGTGRGRPPEFCSDCREKRKQGPLRLVCLICAQPNPFPEKDPWADANEALCIPCAAADAASETDEDERAANTLYYAGFGIEV